MKESYNKESNLALRFRDAAYDYECLFREHVFTEIVNKLIFHYPVDLQRINIAGSAKTQYAFRNFCLP